VPRAPLLPAGPGSRPPARGRAPGSEDAPAASRAAAEEEPAHAARGTTQQGTATLHGARVWGTATHPAPLPTAMLSASPRTRLPLGKPSLWVAFLPATAALRRVAPCQGCSLSPKLRGVPRVCSEPAPAGTTRCRLCGGITGLLEDCDYRSLNRASSPQAVFKAEPSASSPVETAGQADLFVPKQLLMPCSLAESRALQSILASLCSSEDIRSCS